MFSSTRPALDAAQVVAPDRSANHAEVRQYSRRGVFAVWAAAALPMALLAWVIAPAVAGAHPSAQHFAVTLLVALTFGLAWQAVLVLVLVLRERRDAGWTGIRDALWLRAPRTEKRRGGRLWWWIALYGLALAAIDMAPIGLTGPKDRDFGVFIGSAAGQHTFHGAWGLYALVFFELVLNTVLGRGTTVPRLVAPAHAARLRQQGLAGQQPAVWALPPA